MLSVTEAHQRLLAALSATEAQLLPLGQVAGLALAADVAAPEDSPRFANSSMDGFALRATDVAAATQSAPASLKVIADIPAGIVSDIHLETGQAARIMTGAAMPPGADAVIPVEDTDVPPPYTDAPLPSAVQVMRSLESGAYVRPQGEDFASGDVLLQVGTRLRSQEVAMLALLGQAEVSVHRRPKIAILSSGDELVPVDRPLAPGKIRDTNSYALSSLVASTGAEAHGLGIAPDDLDAIKQYLDRAVEEGADLILSSAGVSVGAFDYLREAVQSRGALDFWRVNMRPGKPLAFGSYRDVPFIGLPGNPVSAFVGFEVFVRAALHTLLGHAGWRRLATQAILDEELRSDGRESYLRGIQSVEQDGLHVKLTGHQGSGNLYSLVQADCLFVVPAGVKHLEAGSDVKIWPL